jgi:site-specific DNA recombinase
LEALVIDRLRVFLADAGAVLDAIDEVHGGSGQSHLIESGRQVAEELGARAASEAKATLMSLACRVVVNPDRIDVKISRRRLASLLTGQSTDAPTQNQGLEHDANDVVTLVVPLRLKRVGREMRMLIENSTDRMPTDLSLLRIIARAHDIQARLGHNTNLTVHDVARYENVSAAYIYTLLRLAWLAPDITAAVVNGRQPPHLNAKRLMRHASRLPAEWNEQRTLLGFR